MINKKIIEIAPAGKDAGFGPEGAVEILQSPNGKIKLTPKLKNSIKNFKGYRFLIVESKGTSNTWDDDYSRVFMLLPDKNFVIGAIEFSKEENNIFGTIYQVHYSSVHQNFKGKGLGKLLYEYFVKSYPVVASDLTLFGGSFHIWANIDKYFKGLLYVIKRNLREYILLTGLSASKRQDTIKKAERFVYIYKKSNIPKDLDFNEKIKKLVPNYKMMVVANEKETEQKFLKSIKKYNDSADVDDDSAIDQFVYGMSTGKYIVKHKNMDYIYVLYSNGWKNLQIKDILKSKLKNINKLT